jgi:hypothetical protein
LASPPSTRTENGYRGTPTKTCLSSQYTKYLKENLDKSNSRGPVQIRRIYKEKEKSEPVQIFKSGVDNFMCVS